MELFSEQMDLAFKHDMVAKMWRTAHYPLTDVMRKVHKRATVDDENDTSGNKICMYMYTASTILNESLQLYAVIIVLIIFMWWNP